MTVRELIIYLKNYPSDMEVVVDTDYNVIARVSCYKGENKVYIETEYS